MTNSAASVNGAPQPQFAFFQGEVVPLEDARVSVMTHALHYGTAVFEGIRGNWNSEHETTYIFRLREHYDRLLQGCRILMLDIPYSADDLCHVTVELVQRNANRSDVYIRPLAYKSEELVANLKLHEIASDFTLIVVPFGNYLGTENLRCCTSSWRRLEDQMTPTQIKTSANYLNSILAKTESVLAGFDEAILLNQDGHVSEGSGENLFMMRKGQSDYAHPGRQPLAWDHPRDRDGTGQRGTGHQGGGTPDRPHRAVPRRRGVLERHRRPPDARHFPGQPAHRRWEPRPGVHCSQEDVLRYRLWTKPQVSALVHPRRSQHGRGVAFRPCLPPSESMACDGHRWTQPSLARVKRGAHSCAPLRSNGEKPT